MRMIKSYTFFEVCKLPLVAFEGQVNRRTPNPPDRSFPIRLTSQILHEVVNMSPCVAHEILVTATDKVNRDVELCNISRRQIKGSRLDLEADPFRSGQVLQNGVKAVALGSPNQSLPYFSTSHKPRQRECEDATSHTIGSNFASPAAAFMCSAA